MGSGCVRRRRQCTESPNCGGDRSSVSSFSLRYPVAFPTNTTQLDDTTRTDEDPLGTSGQGFTWSAPVQPAQLQKLRLVGNAIVRSTSAASNSHGYITTVFAANQESHVTVSAVPTGAHFIVCGVRVQNANTASLNAYYGLYINGAPATWIIGRIINNDAPTTLATNAAGTVLTAGDKIGVDVVGDLITVYSFHTGVWTSEVSVSATGGDVVSGPGSLWFELDGAASEVQLTDVRGGSSSITTIAGTGRRLRGYY